MRKRTGWLALAVLLAAMPAAAQKTAKEAETAEDVGTYMEYLKPGENHKLLDPLVGSWKSELRVWLRGSPPPEAKAVDNLEVRWVLDGRFLESTFTTDLPPGPLPRLKGTALMGYNVAQKRFFRLYLNDHDTRETYSTGLYIPSKKALVLRGYEIDPITGDGFEKMDVFTFLDDKDRFRYELFYIMADGAQIKAAEGTYVRKK